MYNVHLCIIVRTYDFLNYNYLKVYYLSIIIKIIVIDEDCNINDYTYVK